MCGLPPLRRSRLRGLVDVVLLSARRTIHPPSSAYSPEWHSAPSVVSVSVTRCARQVCVVATGHTCTKLRQLADKRLSRLQDRMFRAVGLVRAARVAVRAFAPAEAYAASAKSSSWVVASRGFTSSPITVQRRCSRWLSALVSRPCENVVAAGGTESCSMLLLLTPTTLPMNPRRLASSSTLQRPSRLESPRQTSRQLVRRETCPPHTVPSDDGSLVALSLAWRVESVSVNVMRDSADVLRRVLASNS